VSRRFEPGFTPDRCVITVPYALRRYETTLIFVSAAAACFRAGLVIGKSCGSHANHRVLMRSLWTGWSRRPFWSRQILADPLHR